MRHKPLYLFLSALTLSCAFFFRFATGAAAADEPQFTMRGIVMGVSDLENTNWSELALKNGLNTIGTHVTPAQVAKFMASPKGKKFYEDCRKNGIEIEHQLHAMDELLPRSFFKKDPEMFRMDGNGKRSRAWNFCVHSQKALDIVAQNALHYAKILTPTNHRYYFWTDDNKPTCLCPKCKDFSASEQALIIENAIIRELRKFDPQAQLAHLSYMVTLAAPRKVKPEPGIFLEFAPIQRRYDKPLSDAAARKDNTTHGQLLQALKENLEVFPAETAVVLEYWVDVSLHSNWRKKKKEIPWNKDIYEADLKTYASFGIRNVTSFGVDIQESYFQKFPQTHRYLSEYGNGMKNFKK